MKGEQHITRPEQYALVCSKGGTWKDRLLVMRALPNDLTFSRYGFSISKRVGKAVIRNRVKRLLREILRIAALKPGWDVVFIARGPAATAEHAELTKSVSGLLSCARLAVE